MIEAIQEIFSYQFNQRALLAALMAGFLNGYMGGYVVLRKGSLFAGALSHTLFPGIAVGALIAGLNPYSALVGAFVMALAVGLGSQGIAANSRVDREAAMAILYTATTAGGLIILQRLGTYAKVEEYLFGNILRVANWDLWFMYGAGLAVLSVVLLLQRPLLVFIFSADLAASHGLRIRRLDYLLAALVVVTMVTSLQAVGALLALGLLVAPAATLYLFVNSPRAILWGGGVMGMIVAGSSVLLTNLLDVQTGPAMVVLLAGGVSAIMNNTQTMGTILHSMEQAVSGASAGLFTLLTILVNVPLGMLIPSSSGHGALAMPLLAPLADFAGVDRATTITAWIMGHGLALMFSPTSVVLVGGLAIAKVGYDKFLRFAWPLLIALFVVSAAVIGAVATLS